MSESSFREELDLLRAELVAFRAETAREVRTRRLVVDEVGAERICTDLNGGCAELSVQWQSADGNEARAVVGAHTVDEIAKAKAVLARASSLLADIDGQRGVCARIIDELVTELKGLES